MKLKPIISALIIGSLFNQPLSLYGKNDKNFYIRANEITDSLWRISPPGFDIDTVPCQYADAPAVIISEYEYITAHSKKSLSGKKVLANIVPALAAGFVGGALGGAVYGMVTPGFSKNELIIDNYLLRRVKVNTAEGVEMFSTIDVDNIKNESGFNFDNDEVNVISAVRIIKPDGQTISYNIKELQQMRDPNEMKLVLGELQPGDILDYMINASYSIKSGSVFPAGTEFRRDVPIMHLGFKADLSDKLTVSYKTYNGAPLFEKSEIDDGVYRLEVSETNLPSKPMRFIDDFSQIPYFRMKISSPGYNQKTENDGKSGLLVNQSHKEIISDYMNAYSRLNFDSFPVGKIVKGSPVKKIKKAIEQGDISKAEGADLLWNVVAAYDAFDGNGRMINFVTTFGKLLGEIGIDNRKMGVVMPNGQESVDSLIFWPGLEQFIYIPEIDKYYFGHFYPQAAGHIPAQFQNRKAYVLNGDIDSKGHFVLPKDRDCLNGSELFTFKASSSSENCVNETFEISLDQSLNGINATLSVGQKGAMISRKIPMIKEEALSDFDSYFKSNIKGVKIDFPFDYQHEDSIMVDSRLKADAVDYLSDNIYKPIFIDNFRTGKTGINSTEVERTFSLDCFIGDLIEMDLTDSSPKIKVALNEILMPDLGRKEPARTDDYKFDFPKTISKSVTFTIPERHFVDESFVEMMNKRLVSDYFKFDSTAKIEGNKLVMSMKTEFLTDEMPASESVTFGGILDKMDDMRNMKLVLLSE